MIGCLSQLGQIKYFNNKIDRTSRHSQIKRPQRRTHLEWIYLLNKIGCHIIYLIILCIWVTFPIMVVFTCGQLTPGMQLCSIWRQVAPNKAVPIVRCDFLVKSWCLTKLNQSSFDVFLLWPRDVVNIAQMRNSVFMFMLSVAGSNNVFNEVLNYLREVNRIYQTVV